MRFRELGLAGCWRIELEPLTDDRGWFARTYCAAELREHGIDPTIAQENVSWNEHRGTLRGMHLQEEPSGEGKHIRCVRGRIYDVLVDLRTDSPTHRQWVGVELDESDPAFLFAPPGVAHGFLTVSDAVQVEYRMTTAYDRARATGVRWDDPAFGIAWPEAPRLLSAQDRSWPDYPT